ncbi:glycosyl transferase family 4 domain-containing protein [Ditylenchus destructor]|uniref:UDP-N-acetylglucosamine--dolichyl-phosphate N-acetylglucosaminephosphotransferase n=1 Tax=Ditylenchus destructor TaxID=166010 RepID=A0AAD4RBA5_9BILA|nr:glycosyl transferase family 4 domain-containing protein [Ditylenchus destructor]
MDLGMFKTLLINSIASIMAGFAAHHFMNQFIPLFIQREFHGKDQCKTDKRLVVEPMGVVTAAVYLIFEFAFIPVPFYEWIGEELKFSETSGTGNPFPYIRLLSLLAGLISICTAILLGFADDMLDLRWRHKLVFPTLSSMPLIMVYIISRNATAMRLPTFLEKLLGTSYIDLGPLFYIYIVMLVIFCMNAINIIAGINGVEVGQGVVIASSVAVFNFIQLFRLDHASVWHHGLSLCILLPFISTSLALYMLNKYPAKVFVGDTYCYWAGMTLAVVAILNFLYSTPQLFNLVPCPRHRLPKLNPETGMLEMSTTEFEWDKLKRPGKLCVNVLRILRSIHYREFEKDGKLWVEINNLTILNFILKVCGPTYEYELTNRFLLIQLAGSVIAFFCRFYLSSLLYETVH